MSSTPPDIDLELPYITHDLPGIGGRIRVKPSHFVVEEIPLYEPCGEGNHLYINITKENMNTRDVQLRLAKLFNLDPSLIGKAGLKDKHAVTTQTFSIPFDGERPEPSRVAELVTSELPVKVNWAKYHTNKLRAGHLKGNRFIITVTNVGSDALEKARLIAERIHQIGVPNYYGAQRTGSNGENIYQGWLILKDKKKLGDRWLRKYLISSYQSYLFNKCLALRVKLGLFTRLLRGDIAKKHETGGVFYIEDVESEQRRFDSKEVSFTAPMYGYKMMKARYEAGELEDRVLSMASVDYEELRRHGVKGTRRMGRVLPRIILEESSEGLRISFDLPKGSYATTVLREFMKNDYGGPIQ